MSYFHRTRTFDPPIWREFPALMAIAARPQFAMGGNLWSLRVPTHAWTFDGTTWTQRGAFKGGYAYNLWQAGNAIYAVTYGTRAIVTYSEASNPLTFAALCTQAGSGATGYFLRDIPAATGSRQAVFFVVSGTFSAAGIISEAANQITATAVTNASWWFLEKSTDGVADFMPKRDVYRSTLQNNFCDCGVIANLGGAGVNQRLLLHCEYNNTGELPSLLYNIPDVNDVWTALFTVDAGAISHFHGMVFCPGVGGGAGRLHVFTGDFDAAVSILTCDDVVHLKNNGATWKTRWAFDLADAARIAYLTTGAGAPYCAGAGSQSFRTVEAVPDAATNAANLYYLPDATSGPAYGQLHRIVTATNVAAALGTKKWKGTGWHGVRTAGGNIVITTRSEMLTDLTAYAANNDDSLHIFTLKASGAELGESGKYPRRDAALPPGSRGGYYGALRVCEFDGKVWMDAAGDSLDSTTRTMVGELLATVTGASGVIGTII